jgi:hypothetical protein
MERVLREPDITEVEQSFRDSFDIANGRVVYFPVRHHSPGCAIHLRQTIERYNPDLILIEGPSDSHKLLPYIADSNSVAPFCIYYSYDDKDGRINDDKEKYRAYYPFLDYSPELVAIREAAVRNTPVCFIDLPYAVRLVNRKEEAAETQYYYNENKEFEVNTYTAMIAARAGCRSFSEFWESRYELNAAGIETNAFVRNVFYLGYYMRMSTPASEASYKEDVLREQYMTAEIKKSLPGHHKILVVAGAFHIKGLMEALKSEESLLLKPVNKENVASYLMPYTYRETDSQSGYAAGMPFPAFYQEVWESIEKEKEKKDVILDYIVKTARYARKAQSVSLPDEINAYTMARSLAVLRGKPAPGVYELLDGVKSAFVKGDIHSTSTFEVDFLLRMLSGMGAGKVVANEHIPPVVKEFRALCSVHRIKTSTIERQEMTLDIIKNPAHYRKSRFLHQLLFLETSFCTLQSGPDYVNRKDRNLVREIWICRYSTQVETKLIDLSVYGASLSLICISLIEKSFKDSMNAEELGKLLISVQVMGIEGFYTRYEETIRQIITGEKNFTNLCKLIASLEYLLNMQRLMDGQEESLIPELCQMAFHETVEQIAVVRQTTEEEEQAVCEQMRNLYGFVLSSPRYDTTAFHEAVRKALDDGFSNSRFFGVCLAIRYKEGFIEQELFGHRISAYLTSSITRPEEAASFICGLFLVARDILFADNRILEAIDEVIGGADNETFLAILPNLRYAFTGFLPTELARLGRTVAEYHQVSEHTFEGSTVVSEEEVKEGMRLDALAADALNTWGL